MSLAHSIDYIRNRYFKPSLSTDDAIQKFKSLNILPNRQKERCQAIHAIAAECDDKSQFFSEVAKVQLERQELRFAEDSAVLSIKHNPGRMPSYRVLSEVMNKAGKQSNADALFAYVIPDNLLQRHFSSKTVHYVKSTTAAESKKVPIFKAQHHSANPPRQIQHDTPEKLSATVINEREAFTTILKNGKVWFDGSLNTVIWDKAGSVVKDLCQGYPEVIANRSCESAPLHLNGRVFLAGNRNPHNYYHWMNDIVPMFELLNLSKIDINSIDYFVLNSSNLEFQLECLQALGVKPSKIISLNNGRYFTCDELIVSKFGNNTLGMGHGRWVANYLKRLFNQESSENKFRKLYISRGSTGSRSISNEKDVIKFLKDRDFEVVYAERLTTQQKAKLFSQANIVLGPHGAGFTSIAFCSEGAKVVELYCDVIVPAFWNICQLHGLEHYIHKFPKPTNSRRNTLHVCLDELENLLDYVESTEKIAPNELQQVGSAP